jgi:hypothetical protein
MHREVCGKYERDLRKGKDGNGKELKEIVRRDEMLWTLSTNLRL